MRAEVSTHRIFVDVIAMGLVRFRILHPEFFEAVFPDRHFRFESEGEASFDVLHGLLDGDVGRGR